MLLWRLPQASLRPRAFEGSSPEMVRTQGRFHCPFCQTCPKPPQLWQLAPSGIRVFPCSIALICPQHPSAQVLPPAAELSPSAVQRYYSSLQGGRSPLQPHSGSRKPPPDQHLDSPLSLQPSQAVPEKLLPCVTGSDRQLSGYLVYPIIVFQHCFSLMQLLRRPVHTSSLREQS